MEQNESSEKSSCSDEYWFHSNSPQIINVVSPLLVGLPATEMFITIRCSPDTFMLLFYSIVFVAENDLQQKIIRFLLV